ncbi:hypothetical protein PAPYR_4115 [Paratrimastix pyriformis]|uniref:Hemerythrin-like domain-containing protein n=1 Tax=Paratrimastix pyriformis TaxID=342808 RepID=A0ABQ8UMN8_9EUKA|nr:hypothetical protein PAPYR_4115 [Paratrimastix pyriformis]
MQKRADASVGQPLEGSLTNTDGASVSSSITDAAGAASRKFSRLDEMLFALFYPVQKTAVKNQFLSVLIWTLELLQLLALCVRAVPWPFGQLPIDYLFSFSDLTFPRFYLVTTSYIVFGVLSGILLLTIGSLVFVAYLHKQQFPVAPWVFRLQFLATRPLVTCLFVPMLTGFLMPFECAPGTDGGKTPVHAVFRVACWGTPHAIVASFGIGMTVLFIPIALLLAFFTFDHDVKHGTLFASPSGRYHVAMVVGKAALVAVGVHATGIPALRHTLHVVVFGVLWLWCLWKQPYYHQAGNALYGAMWGLCLVVAIFGACTGYVDPAKSPGGAVAFWVVLLLAALGVALGSFFLARWRGRSLWALGPKDAIPADFASALAALETATAEEALNAATATATAPTTAAPGVTAGTQPKQAVLTPTLPKRYKRAGAVEPALRFIIQSKRLRKDPQYVAYADLLWTAALRKHKRDAFLQMQYAIFLQTYRKALYAKVSLALRSARQCLPDMDVRFLIYSKSRDWEQLGGAGADAYAAMSLHSKRRNFAVATKNHEAAIVQLRELWNLLLREKVDMSRIQTVVSNIVDREEAARASYERLLETHPNSVDILRSYGSLLRDIYRDDDQADAIFQRADQIEEDTVRPHAPVVMPTLRLERGSCLENLSQIHSMFSVGPGRRHRDISRGLIRLILGGLRFFASLCPLQRSEAGDPGTRSYTSGDSQPQRLAGAAPSRATAGGPRDRRRHKKKKAMVSELQLTKDKEALLPNFSLFLLLLHAICVAVIIVSFVVVAQNVAHVEKQAFLARSTCNISTLVNQALTYAKAILIYATYDGPVPLNGHRGRITNQWQQPQNMLDGLRAYSAMGMLAAQLPLGADQTTMYIYQLLVNGPVLAESLKQTMMAYAVEGENTVDSILMVVIVLGCVAAVAAVGLVLLLFVRTFVALNRERRTALLTLAALPKPTVRRLMLRLSEPDAAEPAEACRVGPVSQQRRLSRPAIRSGVEGMPLAVVEEAPLPNPQPAATTPSRSPSPGPGDEEGRARRAVPLRKGAKVRRHGVPSSGPSDRTGLLLPLGPQGGGALTAPPTPEGPAPEAVRTHSLPSLRLGQSAAGPGVASTTPRDPTGDPDAVSVSLGDLPPPAPSGPAASSPSQGPLHPIGASYSTTTLQVRSPFQGALPAPPTLEPDEEEASPALDPHVPAFDPAVLVSALPLCFRLAAASSPEAADMPSQQPPGDPAPQLVLEATPSGTPLLDGLRLRGAASSAQPAGGETPPPLGGAYLVDLGVADDDKQEPGPAAAPGQDGQPAAPANPLGTETKVPGAIPLGIQLRIFAGILLMIMVLAASVAVTAMLMDQSRHLGYLVATSGFRTTVAVKVQWLALQLFFNNTQHLPDPTVINALSTDPVWKDMSHLSTDRSVLQRLLLDSVSYLGALHNQIRYGNEATRWTNDTAFDDIPTPRSANADESLEALQNAPTMCLLYNTSNCREDRIVNLYPPFYGVAALMSRFLNTARQLGRLPPDELSPDMAVLGFVYSVIRYDLRDGLDRITELFYDEAVVSNQQGATTQKATFIIEMLVIVFTYLLVLLPTKSLLWGVALKTKRMVGLCPDEDLGDAYQLVWRPEMRVHHEGLDRDHEAIVGLANQWLEALAAPEDDPATGADAAELGHALRDALQRHVRLEEGLMRAQQYPQAGPHMADHRALVAKAQRLMDQAAKGRVGANPAAAGQLLRRFVNGHIPQHDGPLAAWLAARG